MKKIITLLLFLSILTGNKIYAQMATAQKAVWDIEKTLEVNIPQYAVWKILNTEDLLKKYSNGYLKSVTISNEDPAIINKTFSNGAKRSGKIVQNNNQYKFMVIKIGTEYLPKGVKNAEIAIFTGDVLIGRSEVNWKAKIEGNKSGKKLMEKQLLAEFDAYIIGFGKIKAGSVE